MKDALKVYVPLAGVALLLIFIMLRFVAPPPPKTITFAGGGVDGQYYALAQQYRDALSVHGIEVEVLETGGTIDNYALLKAGEADVALLQGGLATDEDRERTLSLGGMFAEPFWVFVRADNPALSFGDLRGQRLAAGGAGSGTRALTEDMQAEWGSTWPDLLLPSGSDAANALLAGEIDAAIFAASVEADYVEQLLSNRSVRLLEMQRADGLSMRHPALAPVILYQGVYNIGQNQPAEDITLIAAIAQLGARADLHPAIQSVLIEAAESIHGEATILSRAGSFPAPDLTDLTLSEEARRYYRNGPTFLRRYFSFDVANFLERAWVFLIPLLTLLIPLIQAAPPVYRWRIRRKIYVWYNDLHELERRGLSPEAGTSHESVLEDIRALQHEVGKVDVPVSYNDELYQLRSHINFVEALIAREAARQQN